MANGSGTPANARHWSRRRLFSQRGNGLGDDTWIPVLMVGGQMVGPLLADLRSSGIPAYCARFRSGWHIPPSPATWCVWVGASSYRQAELRLAVVLPRLIRSLYRAPIGLAGNQ
jgi:hypothetical protein